MYIMHIDVYSFQKYVFNCYDVSRVRKTTEELQYPATIEPVNAGSTISST